MRKVVLYTLMSLDGDVDHPAAAFTPTHEPGRPPEFDAVMADNLAGVIRAQDTVLLGRGMYDEWSDFWPNATDEPFAEFINNVKKYVLTSTPLGTGWNNAEAFAGSAPDLVRDLKNRPGGDIGVHGSVRLAQSLLQLGLVDELRLVVAPAIGFSGRRLFADLTDVRRLELLDARPTPSGSVLLAYRVS